MTHDCAPITSPIRAPFTEFVGVSIFTQWFVFDGAAVNGVLSATDGLWSVIAPVGG